MAAPVLAQSTSNSVCRYQTRTVTAVFDHPTAAKNLIYLTISAAGSSSATFTVPSGFVLIRNKGVGSLQLATYYYQGAPSMNSVTVTTNKDQSLHVRAFEYAGAAQTNALDQVSVSSSQDDRCDTGTTPITQQPDEIVVAAVANRYASTTQSGFTGGLTRLFEALTPQYYGWSGWNNDEDRHRCTHHHLIASQVAQFFLRCYLSSRRDWIAIVVTFRGGSSGPKRMTSTTQPAIAKISGGGQLTAFGPLRSTQQPAAIALSGGASRMSLFNYQYRLGSWTGLLIGSGTVFRVQGTDGLGGHDVRTSDDDLPRGDGSLRGIDLESARQVSFTVNVDGPGRDDVERNVDTLYRALIPQRDTDWELIWRHPTQPMKKMLVRPVSLPRTRDNTQLTNAKQTFILRASDPRHYAAVSKVVTIPVSPASGAPIVVQVVNDGDIAAYPIITITGPKSSVPVTRVQLINDTALVTFDVALTLPRGSTLVGDMAARATGAPRSIITLDGQSKYGSWQLPRDPFRIDPDPAGQGSFNNIRLVTEPAGAPVTCTIEFSDTWAG
jgi:hypothetical protein